MSTNGEEIHNLGLIIRNKQPYFSPPGESIKGREERENIIIE